MWKWRFLHKWYTRRTNRRSPTSTIPSVAVSAPARILAITETGVTVNGQPQVSCQLEVQPEGADSFMAAVTLIIPAPYLQQLTIGTVVLVKYDPADASRVRLAI